MKLRLNELSNRSECAMFQGCGFAHSSVLERQEILHWPNQDRKVLEEGDVEEGLNAAAQTGDDRMQKHAQGYLVPEGFTHGGTQQRVRWFRQPRKSGSQSCDTFSEGAV